MRTINHHERAKKIRSIVKAAKKCFKKEGFHAAGMAKICKAAKLSTGAMYAYFESKDEIIVAVAKDYVEEIYEFIEALESSKDPLNLLVLAAKEEFKARPDSLELEIFAEAMRNDKVMQVFERANIAFKNTLASIFKDLGMSTKKSYLIADYLSSIYDGLKTNSLFNHNSKPSEISKLFEQTLIDLIKTETKGKKRHETKNKS